MVEVYFFFVFLFLFYPLQEVASSWGTGGADCLTGGTLPCRNESNFQIPDVILVERELEE
jgi:hypothetical protein